MIKYVSLLSKSCNFLSEIKERKMSMKRIIYISAIWILFFTFPDLKADEFTFPDKNRKIVGQGENYKIRLIVSKESGVKAAEAVFLIKATPETEFKTVMLDI